MRTFTIAFTLFFTVYLNAQQSVSLVHQVPGLPACESAVYDKESDLIFTSYMGNKTPGDGGIATVTLEGTIHNKNFITGLEDPKGIAIAGDKLFVSDVTVLIEANKNTGEILKRHKLDEIEFLNDVAIGPGGEVYVTDTRASKIFMLDTNDTMSLWLDAAALDNPNGILIDNGVMYIASWGAAPEGGRVSKVNMETKEVTTLTGKIGNLDGIRPYDENHLIISDWRSGKIHTVNLTDGTTTEILEVGISVGDIAFLVDKKVLLLPMNRQGRLLVYKF